MREIFFKAKRKNWQDLPQEKWWVEGYLMDENYINVPFNDDDVCGRFDEPLEVEPETICQYTGMTDKNGEKIWENDIIKFSDTGCEGNVFNNEATVVYGAGRSELDDFRNYDSSVYESMNYAHADFVEVFDECEVVGNAFDSCDADEI